VIQHGGGSSSAYPVARDVLTFLYDREQAMEKLLAMEESWGGTISERMDRQLAAYRAQKEREKAIAEGRVPPPQAETDGEGPAAEVGQ
jgi:penicillin-binding protein 2